MQITARTLPTPARVAAPQQQPTPEPLAPPAADDSTERYVKTAFYTLEGLACVALGRAAVAHNGPLNLFCGAMAGASGGGAYGHVGDIFANIMNPGVFQKHYEVPGMLVGGALGAGAAYLASGHPAVGLALGVGCAVPQFLNAVRAYRGLE